MVNFVILFAAPMLFLSCYAEAAATGASIDKEKLKEHAKIIINECKTKVGASDADVESLKMKQMPSSKEGLCMLECLFNSGKIMKDGKFDKEGMITAFTPLLQANAEKLEKLKELADICEKEIGTGNSDPCETAKLIAACAETHGKKYQIDFEKA